MHMNNEVTVTFMYLGDVILSATLAWANKLTPELYEYVILNKLELVLLLSLSNTHGEMDLPQSTTLFEENITESMYKKIAGMYRLYADFIPGDERSFAVWKSP